MPEAHPLNAPGLMVEVVRNAEFNCVRYRGRAREVLKVLRAVESDVIDPPRER